MDSVLIVSNTNTTLGIISDMLNSQQFSRITTTQNCAEARRDLIDDTFDLIIIDSPLPDELGDDFALYAAERTTAGIILIGRPILWNVMAKPNNVMIVASSITLILLLRQWL